ncbi:hypothetical protein PIB30_102678, partial [Stylosanthes scabra]|nr:hypothetical protein [Stylosanthes scabra]
MFPSDTEVNPKGECKAITLRSWKALEDVNNKVNVQTTKGDNKAIPYPKVEDAEGCIRIDVIKELIMEVQKEEAMQKFQAKQA